MNNILVIAEKPSVALRIATAFGNGKFERKINKNISYYEINKTDKKMYVVAAVGHLFTIIGKHKNFPVLDVEWAPAYNTRSREYTKNYLDVIVDIAKKCNFFINACDYDIEGTVIGTNIIKTINKNLKNSKRMKFSTTTNEDIIKAYNNLMDLDINNFYAGEARHMLDWLWGINLSIALTRSVYNSNFSKNTLSIGRVQGPSLGLLTNREFEISNFIPKPFWKISIIIKNTEFINTRNQIFDEKLAKHAYDETNTNKDNGNIKDIEQTKKQIISNPPFDLTALQLEASKILHMDPSRTLSIAQSLYEQSFISYPRTSSQKLPASLDLPKIIESLSRIKEYENLAKSLLKEKKFKPIEGKKEDEAHPSIYPTGEKPNNLDNEQTKLFDLITRRFLACFADPMEINRTRIIAVFGNEKYAAAGNQIAKKGWTEFYTFYKPDELILQGFEKNEKVSALKINSLKSMTQPPKRYSKATLIAELEKHNLGTKATRAGIIDTLFKRNYIEGTNITVTKFGISIYNTLEKYCRMIVDEDTTRRLETDMDLISRGKKEEQEVINEGKKILLEALDSFEKNKQGISQELRTALNQSQIIILGKCPKDQGNLVIKKSKAGKLFVGCDNYPNCTNTYPLPGNSKIIPTQKVCEYCHTPIIKVIRFKKIFEMDLDPNCQTKKDWYNKSTQASGASSHIDSKNIQKSESKSYIVDEGSKKNNYTENKDVDNALHKSNEVYYKKPKEKYHKKISKNKAKKQS